MSKADRTRDRRVLDRRAPASEAVLAEARGAVRILVAFRAVIERLIEQEGEIARLRACRTKECCGILRRRIDELETVLQQAGLGHEL